MADYLTTDTELTSIADAIRSKGGTSASLTYPNDFISAIEAITTGGTYQSKSVSPTESQQTVSPDTGYDALSSVTVSAISTTYVGSGVARKSSSDLTASGATVTAPAGYYSSAASKSVGSGSATTPATTITANPTISVNSSTGLITASNSKTQSVTPTVSAGYVSSGTAGTITVSGSNTSQLTTQAAQTITPTTSDQTIASGKYLTGTQTIKGDANLIASNIMDGVTIFNVTGTATGLVSTDALLRVQAYAGSTVTITKGQVTKTDAGHENANDHTVYDYYFVIHQSQFDNNPWTVTAVHGTDTASETIVINAADEYDVVLSFGVLYLYHNGIIYNRESGGLTAEYISGSAGVGTVSLTNQNNRLEFDSTWTSGGNTFTHLGTTNKIDLSKYSKMTLVISSKAGPVSANNALVGIFTTISAATSGSIASTDLVRSSSSRTYTLNLASISNSAYVDIRVYLSSSGYYQYINITDWYLEV